MDEINPYKKTKNIIYVIPLASALKAPFMYFHEINKKGISKDIQRISHLKKGELLFFNLWFIFFLFLFNKDNNITFIILILLKHDVQMFMKTIK